jgi:predicted XRE-type DNA-binding protein
VKNSTVNLVSYLRKIIVTEINKVIKLNNMTKEQVCDKLKCNVDEVNLLSDGNPDLFRLDHLIIFAQTLGIHLKINIESSTLVGVSMNVLTTSLVANLIIWSKMPGMALKINIESTFPDDRLLYGAPAPAISRYRDTHENSALKSQYSTVRHSTNTDLNVSYTYNKNRC